MSIRSFRGLISILCFSSSFLYSADEEMGYPSSLFSLNSYWGQALKDDLISRINSSRHIYDADGFSFADSLSEAEKCEVAETLYRRQFDGTPIERLNAEEYYLLKGDLQFVLTHMRFNSDECLSQLSPEASDFFVWEGIKSEAAGLSMAPRFIYELVKGDTSQFLTFVDQVVNNPDRVSVEVLSIVLRYRNFVSWRAVTIILNRQNDEDKLRLLFENLHRSGHAIQHIADSYKDDLSEKHQKLLKQLCHELESTDLDQQYFKITLLDEEFEVDLDSISFSDTDVLMDLSDEPKNAEGHLGDQDFENDDFFLTEYEKLLSDNNSLLGIDLIISKRSNINSVLIPMINLAAHHGQENIVMFLVHGYLNYFQPFHRNAMSPKASKIISWNKYEEDSGLTDFFREVDGYFQGFRSVEALQFLLQLRKGMEDLVLKSSSPIYSYEDIQSFERCILESFQSHMHHSMGPEGLLEHCQNRMRGFAKRFIPNQLKTGH